MQEHSLPRNLHESADPNHQSELPPTQPKDLPRLPLEPELIHIPAGPFLMGTSDEQIAELVARFDWAKDYKDRGIFAREQPQHEVDLAAFEIGRYPVTNAQYAAFVAAAHHPAPSHWQQGQIPAGQANHPVVHVSWHDAQAYLAWLRSKTGRPYRLPTEAEWEKAARGTDARHWPWGDAWDPKRCNSYEGGKGGTTPVGHYSPSGDSPYGCADMAGNVWEWVADWYQSDYYSSSPTSNPPGPASASHKELRGGSWYYSASPIRAAYRDISFPVFCVNYYGFRCAGSPGG